MTLERARELRHRMTRAEVILWQHLRAKQLGVKFRRQEPFGPYVVDFICHSPRLIIEVDSSQHAGNDGDRDRDLLMRRQGYWVLRFWNNDVINNPAGVIEEIGKHLSVGSGRAT